MQPSEKWISRACFDTATREYVVGEWGGEWPTRPRQASGTKSLCLFILDELSVVTWIAMRHDRGPKRGFTPGKRTGVQRWQREGRRDRRREGQRERGGF